MTGKPIVSQVGNQGEDIENLKAHSHRMEAIMLALVIVLLGILFATTVAIASIVMDGFRTKEASYQQLIDKLDEQADAINFLLLRFDD